MPSRNYLTLRFENDHDGSGKLLARVEAAGYSGEGGAYFNIEEILEFADAIAAYPLSDERSPKMRGGFGKSDGSGELEQELLSLRVYPIDARGHIGVEVRVSTEHWPHMRVESVNSARVEVITTYGALQQFSSDVARLVQGDLVEATLPGEWSNDYL